MDPNQMETLKKTFDEHDTNKNGVLEKAEALVLIDAHYKADSSHRPTKEEIDNFMTKMDKDKDGKVSFEEFKQFVVENVKSNFQFFKDKEMVDVFPEHVIKEIE